MKNVLVHQNEAPCYKPLATTVRLHELRYELLSRPPYSSDLSLGSIWLFPGPERMFQAKRFGPNDKVIAATESDYVEKDTKMESKFEQKKLFFFTRLMTI